MNISQPVHYRPEIDGLRAVAVLSVMVYHAGPSMLPGGFLGVDVFFVISGFLITGALMSAEGSLRHILANFWMRRIRRIMPALLVCIAGTLLLGMAILPPSGLDTLARSALAALFSASNFYFWQQPRGYFHAAAEDNPLIHTWSLGVEEQFYLLYPVALLLLLKYRRQLVWPILLAGSLLSFAIAQWGAWNEPTAAFYLLPFRAWQLGAGALVWFALSEFGSRNMAPRLRDGLAWGGLIAIAASLVLVRDTWHIPAIGALPVIAGSATFIAAARKDCGPGRLLAMRGPVAIGLISYSLYLWHQPLLALSRVAFADVASVRTSIAAVTIALSFPIAWASWKLIELPMRSANTAPRKVLRGAGLGLSISAVLALAAILTSGLPQRLSPAETRLIALLDRENAERLARGQCAYTNQGWRTPPGSCVSGDAELPTIAVVGDSHASAIFGNVGHISSQAERQAVLLFSGGCRAVLAYSTNDPRQDRCPAFRAATLTYLDKNPAIRTVIVSYHWASLVEAPDVVLPDNGDIKGFREFMAQLAGDGRTLILIDPTPMPDVSGLEASYAAKRMRRQPPPGVAYSGFRTRTAPVRAVLDELQIERLTRLDPLPRLCDQAVDTCPITLDGDVIYRDRHHLTKEGAKIAVPEEVLLPLIDPGRTSK